MKRLSDYFNEGEPIEWSSLWVGLALIFIVLIGVVARWLG